MKVSDLIEMLHRHDPDREVILQKDAEGNDYSPLEELWIGAYRPETTWSGEAGLDELTDQDISDGYSKDDVIEDGQKALFLVPVN